jgi:sugar/nucleoside kinase (ribokinase family)
MNQNLILTLLSRSLLLNSIIRKIALKLLILPEMHTYMWKISHPNNISMQARIFHFGSISLIEEPCRSTHLAAMAIARKSGCILSYDPNLRLPLWPSAEAARKGIMSIWDQADIIKV